MYMKKRAVSILLALFMVLGLTAPASAAATPDPSGSGYGVTISQTAEWNDKIPGSSVANVTLQVTSEPRLQTPRDVVIVIDHAASQELGSWQSSAKELAGLLSAVPGTRFALVSYESRAKKLLDFTTDLSALNAAVDGIRLGVNCNAYAGLQEAKSLIDGRADKTNAPCIALFSNGKFNLNLRLTETFGAGLARSVPIYGISGGSYSRGIMSTVCTSLMTVREMAITIGESQTAGPVTVTSSLDTGFTPVNGGSGDVSFSIDNYQYGQTYTFHFSGKLADRTRTGSLTVTGEASAVGNGISASAPPAELERSGLTVTYDANGGSGAPVDNNRYAPGETVSVKPGIPWKQGWNFSGWALNGENAGPSFEIAENTTLEAGWGRGYVKLSSSTVNVKLKGTQMLDRKGIKARYPDEAFYNYDNWWRKIRSITICDKIDIPDSVTEDAIWNLGDETKGTSARAVQAWAVKNGSSYDLYIGAEGGVTAPVNCTSLFSGKAPTSLHQQPLQRIDGLEYLNTDQVTDMSYMFSGCKSLTSVDVSNFNVTDVDTIHGMFQSCESLTTLDFSNWKDQKIADKGWTFNGCTKLSNLTLPDRWVTSGTTNIQRMFSGCKSLTSLDLSSWGVADAKKMDYLFYGCSGLTSLTGGTLWLNYPTSFDSMFESCSSLETFDLNLQIYASNGGMRRMFSGCSSLQELDTSGWTIRIINNASMDSMFYGCSSLTNLNMSSLKIWNVTDTDSMFYGCSSLTQLDLTGWNMKKITYMDNMFQNCANLTTIGTDRLEVGAGCTAKYLQSGCSKLPRIHVFAGDEEIDTLYGQAAPSAALAPQSEDISIPQSDDTPTPDLSYSEPEETILASASALAAPGTALDDNGRPVYADNKIGLWDCGEVTEGQEIFYSLEVQYLDEAHGDNGASGVMTVTNPLPEGLNYNGDAQIVGFQRILSGDNGPTRGTVVSGPSVSGGVLTFTVSGLSAGAKFVVNYSCTVPDPGPATYTEYLNTASVNDGGLMDEADPVLHYIREQEAELYTVTYSYVDAPAGAEVPPAQRCGAGTEISLPVPDTPDGCTFNGWQIDGTGGTVDGLYTVTQDVHFIGSWTQAPPKTVQLDYRFDGGPEGAGLILENLLGVDGAQLEVPEYSTVSAPLLAPVPEGWAFTWTYPDGLEVDRDTGVFNVGTADQWPNGTIQIVGKWTRSAYAVTYRYVGDVPAGSPGLPAETTHPWGTAVQLAPEPASTDTALFQGWKLPDGLVPDENGQFEMPMKTVEIIGTWLTRTEEMKPQVKLEPNGGIWDGSGEDRVFTQEEYAALKDTLAPATRDHYIFLKWNEAPDPEGVFALIVSAVWAEDTPPDPETFTVSFDAQGGTATASQNILAGQPVSRPADPVREDYRFLGWYRDHEGLLPWDFVADLVTGDLTLYAKWERVFTVSFDAQGGTAIASQSVPASQLVSRPADPVREGYRFLGWCQDQEGLLPWNFAADLVTGDLILYAKWEKVDGTYVITGVILDTDGNPVSGALVHVVQGNTLFQETHTGPDGRYTFQQVPPGIYNIVALYNEITTTILTVVKDQDLSLQTIHMSTGDTHSILHVEETTPDVVVGGLAQEAENVRQDAATGGTVETVKVEMEVEQVDETVKPAEIRAIREAAKRDLPNALVDLVLDIDVTKIVKMEGTPQQDQAIHHTTAVLELVIPYDMTGKTGIRVHRYHNAGGDNEGAITFTEIFTRPLDSGERIDRTFYLDRESGLIHVFARKFSTYAVSYTPEEPETPDAPVRPGPSSDPIEKLWVIQASAEPGGTITPVGKVYVPTGADKTFTIQPESGYVVENLIVDGESTGAADSYTFRSVRSNHTIKAVFTPVPPAGTGVEDLLNTTDHIAYFEGFEDGTFRPEESLSRSQTAQVFYRLLRERGEAPRAAFADVPAESWYGNAVNRLYMLGIMTGVSGNRFDPDRAITRAEFVVTAMRFTEQTAETSRVFSDVDPEDWFYLPVMSAVGHGWIEGYTDGTFRPNEPISREEAAVILNRILGRTADKAYIDAHGDTLCQFPDVARDYWAYYEIEEAANAHEYSKASGEEVWTDVTRAQNG